jgi:hypothetical protein
MNNVISQIRTHAVRAVAIYAGQRDFKILELKQFTVFESNSIKCKR